MTQKKVEMIINDTESQYYTNSRIRNITKTYNYNKLVFLHLTIQKSDMKLINNFSKHIFLDYIQFDFQFKKMKDQIFITENMQNSVKI